MIGERVIEGPSFKKIIYAWLLTGTLDIGMALLHYFYASGKPVTNVLKFIASGVLGQTAFTGDIATAMVGLILHYGIALFFTVFYVLFFYKVAGIIHSSFLTGLSYGLLIWLTMFFIVVPLSKYLRCR